MRQDQSFIADASETSARSQHGASKTSRACNYTQERQFPSFPCFMICRCWGRAGVGLEFHWLPNFLFPFFFFPVAILRVRSISWDSGYREDGGYLRASLAVGSVQLYDVVTNYYAIYRQHVNTICHLLETLCDQIMFWSWLSGCWC